MDADVDVGADACIRPYGAASFIPACARDGVLHHRVRGGVHTLAIGVLDPVGRQGDHSTVGLQDLDGIAQVELAALGTVGHAVLPEINGANEVPVPHIGMAGGLLGLLLAKIKARRIVAVAGAVQLLDDIIRQLKVIAVGIAQVGIQGTAVGAGDGCHIVKRLGAALDL